MASDEGTDDRLHDVVSYGNFRKYGTVSCSTSATVQNAAAMNA